MKATEHPEHREEKAYLDRTVAAIDERIADIGTMSGMAADPYTQEQVRRLLIGRLEVLRTVRSSPYFARIDFQEDRNDQEESFYIGKASVEGSNTTETLVIDWRAPVASLFYKRMASNAYYRAPAGIIQGEVLLRRRYDIADAQLRAIVEEMDRRPLRLPEVLVAHIDPDVYLREVLSGKREARLKDIATTIQVQQDAIIRAAHDKAMLIQGAAGSGKTVVALHRLAYLLYPGNQTGIDPNRVIIFGPNRIFLRYIEQVLPDLNVGQIRQSTFEDWALEQIELSNHTIQEDSLEKLYDPSTPVEEKELLRRHGQLKGSLKMAHLLRQYVEARRKAFEIPETGLEFSGVGPLSVTLSGSKEDISEVRKDSSNAPLHLHQQRVVSRIVSLLSKQYETAMQQKVQEAGRDFRERAQELLQQASTLNTLAEELTSGDAPGTDRTPGDEDVAIAANLQRGAEALQRLAARLQDQRRQAMERARSLQDQAIEQGQIERVMAELRTRVEQQVRTLWPRMSLRRDYYALLAQPALLREAGAGILAKEELSLLRQAAPPRDHLRVEDIAPLYYFNITLNGVPRVSYDHMVVDEAQDMSELQLMILKQHVLGSSMTISGDMAQRILSHRSVGSWEDIAQIFDDWAVQREEITVSYRSSFEITAFANELLKRMPGGTSQPLAKPFDRHGPQPVLAGKRRLEDMVSAVAQTIRQVQKDGFKTVAVICKTIRQSRNLAAALRDQGIGDFGVVEGTDFEYRGGVVVIPVYLTKGLEFDVAIVVDVDQNTYTRTEDDARLLYVAVTRPLHQLYLFWVGEVSPLLEHAVSQIR